MQANVITLAVDEQNDSNTVDHVYTRADYFQNRSLYVSGDHTLEARDTLGFYRTQPKQNGNFKGTAKCSLKISTDKLVDGVDGFSQLTSPIIGEVSFSVPVGVTSADKMIARQLLIAILDDDTVMEALMDQQLV